MKYKEYEEYRNGVRIDMMGNYHGGCRNECCRNRWGLPTIKGVNNNCKIQTKYDASKII